MEGKYEPIGLSNFFGGRSTDKKLGSVAQFYDSKHLDFRKNPSSLTLLPEPTNADGGVVVDLVLDMTQINSGVRFAIGDKGFIYRVTTDGEWTVKGQVGESSSGIIYRSDVDHTYITGTNKISRIKRMSDTETFEQNWFNNGVSTSSTCSASGGTETYTTPTTLIESQRRSFTSDIEPLYQLGVKVVDPGTGDWTLTLHDDADNVLGTVTIANADVKSNSINYFTFTEAIRIQRGNNGAGSALTYHFHVKSTVADGTLATTTANNLSDCDLELWANALVDTDNGLHPVMSFTNFTLIGNGRYVAVYEPLQDSPTTADFNRHRITLPPGFNVTSFGQKNLMCVIGAEKRSASGEFQEGALFFWDGTAETYNDWWLVPEGSPESLFSHKNIVYFIAGGSLYRMRGGDEPIKIITFRNSDSEYSGITDITHNYPNMMTVRRGILLTGYPSESTNQSIRHGVYSLGAISREYPESFGFSYTISSGTEHNNGSNNLKMGMVKNYGDTLFISWRDDSANPQQYSVDIVDNLSAPAATAEIETLEYNDSRPYVDKKAGHIICTFKELPADTTVTIKYKINGAADWSYGETITSGTAVRSVIGVGGTKFKTIIFGIDITCAGTDTPEIESLYLFVDKNKNERPLP